MLHYLRFLLVTLLVQSLPLSLISQPTKSEIEYWNTRRPSRFIENKGQVTDQYGNPRKDVKYMYLAPGFKAIFNENSFSYEIYTDEVKSKHVPENVNMVPEALRTFMDTSEIISHIQRIDITLVGAQAGQIIPAEKSEDYNNYYLQHTGEEGIQGVYYYRQLTYRNVWPNIDIVFYARNEGELKYDIIVRPGGDIKNVKFSYKGADGLTLKDGRLQIATSLGNIYEQIPQSYLLDAGEKVQIQYHLKDDCIGLEGSFSPDKTLVIDPLVIWSTYLGGSGKDILYDVDIDTLNNVYGAGLSSSTGIATSGAYQSTFGGNSDALIAKFKASGSIVWCTYFGGTAGDAAFTCAIGKNGDIYMGGEFNSTGMASSGAYLTVQKDALFAKFSNTGSRLWSTYYGTKRILDCVVDTLGNMYLTGLACCTFPGFASANAYQTKFGGTSDAFLIKFTSTGGRAWATYFGDGFYQTGAGCALDKYCNVYLVGASKSDTFHKNRNDGFLTKFDSAGKYKWLNYIGIYGSPDDNCEAVCTDRDGDVYVTGYTWSADTIASNQAYQKKIGGSSDAYIMKFTTNGIKLWGTYFGGTGGEDALSIRTDKYGDLLVTGTTYSSNGISTISATQKSYAGSGDAYIARFTSEGRLSYGTYFGGTGGERGFGIASDTANHVFLCGHTASSSNINTSGAYQTTYAGGIDGFLARFGIAANVDASIARINLEDTFCNGTYNMPVLLHNTGLTRLDSVTIHWTVNGTTQTPYSWKGTLKTDSIVNVGLGNIKFDTGLYSIKVWASKPNNSVDSFPDNDTVSAVFKVVMRSAPDFTFINSCLDSNIVFTNKSIAAKDIKSNLWDFGDSTSSDSTNPVKMYKKPGKYSVKLLTVNVNGCRDSVTKTITVYPKPEVAFSAANSCHGDTIVFTNTSAISSDSIVSYKWDFGDGSHSTLVSPVKVYSKPGTYTVLLKAWSNKGCTDSTSKSIVVHHRPMIKFSAKNACTGEPISFQNASSISGDTISSYQWNFGDGNISSSVNPTRAYSSPGKYLVTLVTTTNKGCLDSVSQPIIIHELPIADFIFADQCSGTSVTFSNTTSSADTIVSSTWSFGDGTTSSSPGPVKTFSLPGMYDVKLVVKTGNGCVDSVSKKVTVYATPKAAFSLDDICLYNYSKPTNNSLITGDTIAQYLWNFGDGSTSASVNPAHRYQAAGTYSVSLKVWSSKGCVDSSSKHITVYPLPEADFSLSQSCISDSTQFVDSSKDAAQWLWSFGDSSYSAAQNPKHKYAAAGKYNVSLIVINATGCKDTITRQVEIFDLPQADFSANNVCVSDTLVLLNYSQKATGYLWQFGDGDTSIMQYPNHKYKTHGTYTIKLTVINNGKCLDSISKEVTIHPLPELTIIDTVSERNVNFFVSDSSYASYIWSFGDGDSSTDKNPFHRYPGIGSYNVHLLATSAQGCTRRFTDTIQILTNSINSGESNSHSIGVYPNPFMHQTRIKYTLEKPSRVGITLFDVRGRMYQVMAPQIHLQGQHQYIINAKESNLKSGIYLLEVKVDEVPSYKKIVKLE